MTAAFDMSCDHRFGRFELQPAERRLLADGVAVGLGPRSFDLLLALVSRAGHLLTKEELFAAVWPKLVVDDSALQVQISSLRKALGAEAIATVSGRGYRFMLPVSRTGTASPRRADGPLHNLPRDQAIFVGRERDASHLAQSLKLARLVTLTGAGGCGKTRLAIEVAAGAVDRYPDGVWFVELASLADPSHAPRALMSVLGVKEPAGVGPLEALTEHLKSRRLLLVLDNAEHLLAACAELADHLLLACAGVSLLVTSRQALGVVGELTYRVPSLTLPDIQQAAQPAQLLSCESVRLFVERARLLQPEFGVTPHNASAVALICWRLDGIPLAIELAAGRMRSMPVDELSQRLDQRFSLLNGGVSGGVSGGTHGVPQRHRTLRSLIDWSYDLLGEAEQALLCRLSVFSGGCSLPAAEQVCSDVGDSAVQVVDLLAALADKNLVLIDEHEGRTRYRMLETVRQYAQERLREAGDEAAWRGRHWTHFFGMAKDALPHNHGPDQQIWFDRFEADKDNLRAALSWSMVAGHVGEGLRLAGRMSHFWTVRGYLTEALSWYATLLAALPADHPPHDRGIALSMVGTLACLQGDYANAKAFCEESLGIFRSVGDPLRTACALSNVGSVVECQGDFAAANKLFDEAIAMFRIVGHASNQARALVNLGNVVRRQGNLAGAEGHLAEALAISRQVGARQAEGTALCHLGTVALLDGRPGEARALLVQSLAVFSDIGDRAQAVLSLEELAQLDASAGNCCRAARLWGVSEQLRDAVGLARPPVDAAEYAGRVDAARAALGDPAAFDLAWHQGRQLSFKQAIEMALAGDTVSVEPQPPCDVSRGGFPTARDAPVR